MLTFVFPTDRTIKKTGLQKLTNLTRHAKKIGKDKTIERKHAKKNKIITFWVVILMLFM